jgi:hypothetical protein
MEVYRQLVEIVDELKAWDGVKEFESLYIFNPKLSKFIWEAEKIRYIFR